MEKKREKKIDEIKGSDLNLSRRRREVLAHPFLVRQMCYLSLQLVTSLSRNSSLR